MMNTSKGAVFSENVDYLVKIGGVSFAGYRQPDKSADITDGTFKLFGMGFIRFHFCRKSVFIRNSFGLLIIINEGVSTRS